MTGQNECIMCRIQQVSPPKEGIFDRGGVYVCAIHISFQPQDIYYHALNRVDWDVEDDDNDDNDDNDYY